MNRQILGLSCSLIFAFSASDLIGQIKRPEIDEVERVEASGLGADHDEALRQALRSAVEQSIGIFLKTETVVENYELISDKILSHSRGYVKTFDILSEGPQGDVYHLKLAAVVVVKELENTLVEMKLFSREVKGESLFGNAFIQIAARKSGAALYEDLRETLITKAIAVEFAEVEVQSVDGDSATVIIPFNLVWDPAFLNDLKDVLEQTNEAVAHTRTAISKNRDTFKPQWNRGYSQIRVWDDYPRPTKTTAFIVKDIYANALAIQFQSGLLIYHLELLLKDRDGAVIFSKKVRRSTRLFTTSKSQTKDGPKVNGVSVNMHVGRDWQRKRNSTYTTITLHVDQLQDVREVIGNLEF